MNRETGHNRGFGIVRFDSEDAAREAIAEMNDAE